MPSRPPPTPQEELHSLLATLPEGLMRAVESVDGTELLEIVLDLGRPPEARLVSRTVMLADEPVVAADLDHVLSRVGALTNDNRAGIERTLHRVSAIRNRQGRVVGLTLRMGRAVFGTIDMLRDLVESGKNLLLLGRPGVGKTTKLREVARVLADDLGKRVMVVDTSNEIGGDGDIPHPAIGGARRMQVARPELQHDVMIEAVENHMPEAIIVDEIGTEAEARAARTIAERGVQLIATAHGNTLENLILNPTLSDVAGGIHTVTLSDEEARRRGTLKTVTERRAPPTFDVIVEMVGRDEVLVHRDTGAAVDALLAGKPLTGERRVKGQPVQTVPLGRVTQADARRQREVGGSGFGPGAGEVEGGAEAGGAGARAGEGQRPLRLHAYGVGRELVEKVVRDLNLDVRIVSRPDAADVVLVVRSRAGEPRIRRLAERGEVIVHVVKRATAAELRRVLRNAFVTAARFDEELRDGEAEMEAAVQRAMTESVAVPVEPRSPRVRKAQQRIAARYYLLAESQGKGPDRHVVVYPPGFSPPPSAAEADEESV